MWQEAKANDRRIKELMVDHKKRAERRRAYYDSRLGDPKQLIRVIGSASKLYPNAEQFYYHENTDNLMQWQGNPDIKIDRFDGRSLLDFVPEPLPSKRGYPEQDMSDELNFERYHDLIEAERLNVTEAERLAEVEEEWTKLLDRHQAKLALLKEQEKPTTSSKGFAFDYGTTKVEDEEADAEKETTLLKEVDILQYVDELTDKDKQILNDMSSKYGIRSYARLLRVAKKDRDSELRSLKKKQEDAKPKEGTKTSRRNEKRRKRRRRERELEREGRYRRRDSPTYEPYQDDESEESGSSEDDMDDDDDSEQDNSDFVIEFGSNAPEESRNSDNDKADVDQSKSDTPTSVPEKKLTPMEKLKLKMRAGLQKQINSDEKDKRQKEKEQQRQHLQELAKSQGLPINTYLRPDPPTRETSTRYRSPSTDDEQPKKERYRSPPTPTKERYRSPSTDKSPSPIRTRNRSPSPPKRRYSPPPRRRYRSPSKSRSPPRRKYRSPSKSRSPPRKRYRSPSPRSRSRSSHSKSYRRRSNSRDRYHSSSSSRHRSRHEDRYSSKR